MKSFLIILAIIALVTFVSRKVCSALNQLLKTKAGTQLAAALEQAIRIIHDFPYEVEYLLDANGNIVCNQTQYNDKEVCFTDEQIAYIQAHPGLISVHNHDEDVPPSIRDLDFAARTRQAFFVVVSPSYVYTVMPGVSGWKSKDQLERAGENHLSLCKIVKQGSRIAGVDRDGAVIVENDIEVETTDAALKAIARDLGYQYSRRKYQ